MALEDTFNALVSQLPTIVAVGGFIFAAALKLDKLMNNKVDNLRVEILGKEKDGNGGMFGQLRTDIKLEVKDTKHEIKDLKTSIDHFKVNICGDIQRHEKDIDKLKDHIFNRAFGQGSPI